MSGEELDYYMGLLDFTIFYSKNVLIEYCYSFGDCVVVELYRSYDYYTGYYGSHPMCLVVKVWSNGKCLYTSGNIIDSLSIKKLLYVIDGAICNSYSTTIRGYMVDKYRVGRDRVSSLLNRDKKLNGLLDGL